MPGAGFGTARQSGATEKIENEFGPCSEIIQSAFNFPSFRVSTRDHRGRRFKMLRFKTLLAVLGLSILMTLFWSEIYAQDHGKALIGVAGRGESPPNSIPTDEQIEEWWKPECREHRDERLEVKEVKPVGLKNGEKAFAASVRFPERAHC